jgi:FMN reductase
VIVGNPKPASRTRHAAEAVAVALIDLTGGPTGDRAGDPVPLTTVTIDLADHGAALLAWGSPEVRALKATVLGATALVVASPTYKAAYTGLLKVFLDQFDRDELGGVPTVAMMTGASPTHALAVEVHLRPVLVEIGASVATRGLFFAGAEVDQPAPVIETWLAAAGPTLRRALAADPTG